MKLNLKTRSNGSTYQVKDIELPVVPRKGEKIVESNAMYQVKDVYYSIDVIDIIVETVSLPHTLN